MTPPQTRSAETGCLPLKRGVSRQGISPSKEEWRDRSVKTGCLPLKRGVSRQGVSPLKRGASRQDEHGRQLKCAKDHKLDNLSKVHVHQ